jgi:hypothetical protein
MNGTASLDTSTGVATYTPSSGTTASSDSFSYTVTDSEGRSATGTVNILLAAQAPVAYDFTVSTDAGVAMYIPMLNEVYVPLGETVTATAIGTPDHGSAVLDLDDSQVTYTPPSDTSITSDSFSYTVGNGHGDYSSATVHVKIVPTTSSSDNRPVAVDQTSGTTPGTAITIPVLEGDTDPNGATLSVQSVGTPNDGTAVINSNGSVTYTPSSTAADSWDSFPYTITNGTETATATVTVGLTGASGSGSDGPIAHDISVSTTPGTPITISPLSNCSESDDNPMWLIGLGSQPSGGSAEADTEGTIVYTPNAGTTYDEFTYTVMDTSGVTGTASVYIQVLPSAGSGSGGAVGPPIVRESQAFCLAAGGRIDGMNLAADAVDPAGLSLSVTLLSAPTHGQLLRDPSTGLYSYVSNGSDHFGIDAFQFELSDGTYTTAAIRVAVLYYDNTADPLSPAITEFPNADDSPIFGPEAGDPLQPMMVAQGSLNDCWFVAAAVGLAQRRRGEIMSRMEDNGNGTYTMCGPKHTLAEIPAPPLLTIADPAMDHGRRLVHIRGWKLARGSGKAVCA